MKNISTIKVTLNDIDKLQKVGKLTFCETYASQNSEENMQIYLNNNFSSKNLKLEVASKNSEFYFAKQEHKIIGYLKMNFGQAKKQINNENTLEIERIYVLNEFQGKKIGQILFEKALEISRQKKVDFIWLGVWEENTRAIQFYKKNGFVEFDQHIFKLGKEEQTDILMKIELN